MKTPISFRSRRACVSETIAALRSLRRLLAGRALIRCDVNAWWRLSLPVLVTRKRFAIALLGFIALRGMPNPQSMARAGAVTNRLAETLGADPGKKTPPRSRGAG